MRRSIIARIFLSPSEPRLRAGWRLLAQLLLLVILYLLLGGCLSVALFSVLDVERLILLSQAVSFLAVTASVYLARRFIDKRSFASLGLVLNRLAVKDLLAGALIAGLMMGLIFGLELAIGWLKVDGFAWQVDPLPWVIRDMLLMTLLFIVVGWQEELLTRGYWLQNLTEGLNLPLAVLLSSVGFALGHWANTGFSWASMIGLSRSGLFFAYSYLATRRLWLPVGLHIGWNFFEGTVFGFPVSGLNFFGLILQSNQGPALMTGGGFGPEAGLVLLPALLFGAALIFGYSRSKRERTAR